MIAREKEVKEGFVPFTVELTFENEAEARLMWHVFNRGNLWEAISEGNYGDGYTPPAMEFNSELTGIIEKHITV